MSNNFITNKDKFLSDIINGILPKSDAVDFLVGYFYYSGYVELSEKLKNMTPMPTQSLWSKK